VNNDKQRTQLWNYILSCHRFAISLNEASQATDQSNESITELSRILLNQEPPPSWEVLDTAAKVSDSNQNIPFLCVFNDHPLNLIFPTFTFLQFCYAIGKRRYEVEPAIGAIPPLLHAIKLLMHVTSLVSPSMIPSLKLSGRLTYIATVYNSIGNADGAVLATMLALVYDSIEVSITDPSSANQCCDFVSWLASFTENVVVVTSNIYTQSSRWEQRLALQKSLLQQLMKRGRSTMVPRTVQSSSCTTLKSSALVDILLESLIDGDNESCCEIFEKRCNVPFNLATILSLFISNNTLPRHKELDQFRVMMEFVKLLTELIVRFGHLLQRSDRESVDDSAASTNDYLSICQFTESIISTLTFHDNVSLPLVLAMMNVIASISLVSIHPTFQFEGWMSDSLSKRTHQGTITYIDMAKKLVDKGYHALNGSHVSDQSTFATLIAIQLYRYQLSQLQADEMYDHIDFKRLQDFYDSANATESLTGNMDLQWQMCLTITLTRLCILLYLDGEELRALQIAKWICFSAVRISRDASVLSETILLTLIAESSIISINATIPESFSHPFQYEEKACKLRLYARDGDYSLSYVEFQFQSLLEDIRNCSSTFGPDCDDVASWSSTTVYLGLSECTERQGRLEATVMYLRKCFEECRTTIAATKRMKSASDRCSTSWDRTRLTYMSLFSVKRQVKCLYQMALLYHRLGNYRKSIEYSFGSLHSPLLEDAGLTSKLTFAQTVSLTRQFPARNSNETMVRRLYLRLKSLTCSLDSVANQFRRDDQPCLSRVDESCKGNDFFINCELEAIVDMYESKCTMYTLVCQDVNRCFLLTFLLS
jgi:hypothetical protein